MPGMPGMPGMSRGCSTVLWGLLMALCFVDVASAEAPVVEQTVESTLTDAQEFEAEGHLATAARHYADAYRMTSSHEDYGGSEVAADIVFKAASLYRAAFNASDTDYTFLRESVALLDAMEQEWTSLGQPIPDELQDQREWAEQQLSQQPPPAELVEVSPTKKVIPPSGEINEDPLKGERPDVTPPPTTPDGDSSLLSRGAGMTLIGLGIATTVGGIVSLAIGAPLRGRAEDYRREVTTSPEFVALGMSDQTTATRHLDAYVGDEGRRGITWMAVGGAAASLGVAAIVVGTITLVRGRRRGPSAASSRLAPSMGVRGGEAIVGLRLGF